MLLDVIDQWRPAATRQANMVCLLFRATRQERADLFEMIPATLFKLVSSAQLAADTPAALACRIVYRAFVKGWGDRFLGIKEWRAGEVNWRSVGGKRRYEAKPITPFSEAFGEIAYEEGAAVAHLPDRPHAPPMDVGAALDAVRAMARRMRLTRREVAVLGWVARGCTFAEAARRMGVHRQDVTRVVTAIRRKVIGYEDYVRDLLA